MRFVLLGVARILIAGLVIGLAVAPLVAAAQGFPNKPVRFIVPFPPGGATDISARIVGQKLSEMWGQTVVIENRGGAGGNVGAVEAAKAAPDGYTLFFPSGSVMTANEHIYANMNVRPERDFVPITNAVRGAQVIVVPADSPYKTLKDLIAAAKANPGKLNYGHAGIGSQTHLAAENFLLAAGIEVQNVPYKGEGPAVADLVAGQTTMATPNVAAAIAFINAGKLRALAVTSRERAPQLRDVPAVAEFIPGFENYGWFGLVAPAGTPKDVVDKVYRDTAKALDSTEMRARFFVQGLEPVGNSPEEFARAMTTERARWAKVVKERRIKAN
jgi:tripartite-type tricarboxylate transporter receptor subunit TctC